MDIVTEAISKKIDYSAVALSSTFLFTDVDPVDIAVIIPVHGRTEFNKIITEHFLYARDNTPYTISITIVEHSEKPEHKELCEPPINYIHIPLNGGKFNKCLCMNMGALYSVKSTYKLFHDADILVPTDFFNKLIANIDGKDAVQAFTKRRLLYCQEPATKAVLKLPVVYRYEELKNDPTTRVGDWGAQGGSMFVREGLFFDVGGFDTELTEYSVEDVLFFSKLETIGKLGECNDPAIELLHLWHPPSFKQTTKPYDYEFLNVFRAMSRDRKERYIKTKADLLKPYIQNIQA